jgi:hypothetical protein
VSGRIEREEEGGRIERNDEGRGRKRNNREGEKEDAKGDRKQGRRGAKCVCEHSALLCISLYIGQSVTQVVVSSE